MTTRRNRIPPITPNPLRWAAPGYALGLTLVVAGPLLAPGYPLLRDAVSTPRSYLSDAALGLGESAPRAVPQDFAVALVSSVIDGGVVVKALLLGGLWLAGCGAARLVSVLLPEAGLAGQSVAITCAIWNPYVAERLLQGQWGLLVGYGCLPWVAATALAAHERTRPRWLHLVFWVALAGLTPTGLMLAATVALVCLVPAGRSRSVGFPVSIGVAVLAAAPWLTSWVVGSSCCAAPAAPGVAAFAARAEPGLGTLGALAGLGGIWNADAVPASRTTVFAVLGTAVLLAVVAAGLPVVLRRPAPRALLILAAVSVLVPAVLSTGPGMAALSALIDAVPGLGVLRDGQKWVGLAMPGYALAGAGAVLAARRWWAPATTALVCCAALLSVLPDLAWGAWGQVTAVHYPAGWRTVSARINADPRPVVVLPAGAMRQFAWSGPAPVLDPLPRWVRAEVLVPGDLVVAGRTVPGEGARARDAQAVLLSGGDAAALAGVGWVLREAGTPGELGASARTLDGLPVAYRDSDLILYRAGGDAAGAPAGRRRAAWIAHLVWLGLLCGSGLGAAVGGLRRRHRSRSQCGSDAAGPPP